MPPSPLAGDLGGGAPAQLRVRPDIVVVVPPGGQHEPGMGHRGEQRLVEALVAQTAIEALDEAVLGFPARCNATPRAVPATS